MLLRRCYVSGQNGYMDGGLGKSIVSLLYLLKLKTILWLFMFLKIPNIMK